MADRRYSTRTFAVAMVLAFLGGVSVTWAFMRRESLREVMSVSLAHELETTGLCANALTLVERSEGAKLSALLQHRLDGAIRQCAWLVDSGARLGIAAPNLVESTRRAAAYYERRNDAGHKRDAELLVRELTEER